MHLNDRNAYCRDGVSQGNAGMGIRPCIENNALHPAYAAMQVIDEFPLNVAMEIIKSHEGKSFLQYFEIVVETHVAIYFRFANAEQIQVGPIYNSELQHGAAK